MVLITLIAISLLLIIITIIATMLMILIITITTPSCEERIPAEPIGFPKDYRL